MFKHFLVTISIICVGPIIAQNKKIELSLEQSFDLIENQNKNLKIADKQIELAKNEHQKINSFWLPSISAAGTFMHFSNKIEVKQSIKEYTDPIKDYIQSIDPSNQLIPSILDQIGNKSLVVPLISQNISSIDANITYPLFTGGKRIYAGRIGKELIKATQVGKQQIGAGLKIALIESYYGLRLSKRVVDVKQEAYQSLEQHYENALKLEQNGMINKAERLFVEVNLKEAKRELEAAIKNLSLTEKVLKKLINDDSDDLIEPVSSLFINDTLPSLAHFKSFIKDNNYVVKQLDIQKEIASNEIKIANSAYMPDIALLGKQTIVSHGIPKTMLPRTFIGAGFTWNIFDGFAREKKIKGARINKQILELQSDNIVDQNELAVDNFYNQIENALGDVDALNTTIEMSTELLRIRQRAYQEGMATSTEVVDAEVMLSKVQIAYLMAYYEYDVALINMLAVCGIPEFFNECKTLGKTENYIFKR